MSQRVFLTQRALSGRQPIKTYQRRQNARHPDLDVCLESAAQSFFALDVLLPAHALRRPLTHPGAPSRTTDTKTVELAPLA